MRSIGTVIVTVAALLLAPSSKGEPNSDEALIAAHGRAVFEGRIAAPRSLEELKEAVQTRADRQGYPVTGLSPGEVREALSRLNSLDRDEWAQAWSVLGQRHEATAQSLEASDRHAAAEEWLAAFRFYAFGAWPLQNAPGKMEAYAKATAAFRHYAALRDPPFEVVHIPFEGGEIVGYLGRPAGAAKPPVVIAIGGLDSYKEFMAERGPEFFAKGVAFLALDMPGTGEAPIKIDVGAERMFSAAIDALRQRADVDGNRIGVVGVSWGGHWAARLGYVERERLKGAVAWGGPTEGYFEPTWQQKALGTREYLFDLFPARATVYGVGNLDEFLAYGPRMKLSALGVLDKPSAPMLLVNGLKDSQVPIEDLFVLLRSGSPKEAWVNPGGGHLGRSADWPDEKILRDVIVPWLAHATGAEAR
jgi:fermentation-respiration switch protein FrsA (DUF1100 family)